VLRRLNLLLVVFAVEAMAQAPMPSVTPFPLELKRTPSSFSKKDGDELKKDFVRAARRVALAPDTASLDVALKELKRQDCDVADECLKVLAVKAQTLYALYAQVEYSLTGQVVATGRVVRDDGKLVVGPQTVTMVKGKDSFKDVAKVALTRLIDQLGVAGLPTFKEVEKPVEVVKPVEKPVEPVKLVEKPVEPPPSAPPIVVRETGPAPMKVAGYVTLGVGGAALVAGALVAALAQPQLGANSVIVPTSGQSPQDAVKAYQAAKGQQTAGFVVLGVGAAVAVTGLVLSVLPSGSNAVTVVPVNGGAVVSVGGTFP
jgi:hypothetical protein